MKELKKDTKIKIERIMKAIKSGCSPKKACKLYGLDVKTYQGLKNQYFKEKVREQEEEEYNSSSLKSPVIEEENLDLNFDFDNPQPLTTTIGEAVGEEVAKEVEEIGKENKTKMKNMQKSEVSSQQLETFRITLNKTYREMAEECGLGIVTLSRFPLSKKTINVVCGRYNVTEEYILGLVPTERNHTSKKNIENTKNEVNNAVLNNKIENLEITVTHLKNENEDLSKNKLLLESKVNEFKAINNGLNKKITEYMEEIKRLNNRILELKNTPTVPNQTVKIGNDDELKKAKSLVVSQGDKIKILENDINNYRNALKSATEDLERYKKLVDRLL